MPVNNFNILDGTLAGQRLPGSFTNQMTPLFVDEDTPLSWETLGLPNISAATATSYQGLVQTFSMPGGASTSGANISVGQTGITFSAAGNYYFMLPCGIFKVCVFAAGATAAEKAFAIGDFVSSCTAHTYADLNRCYTARTVKWAMSRLFRSNSPMGMECGDVSEFVIWLLQQIMGWPSRRVSALPSGGHIFMETTLPGGSKVCLDCDYGVLIENSAQEIISDRANNFANITLSAFAAKKWLPTQFCFQTSFLDMYAWDVNHATGSSTFVDATYRGVLQTYFEEILLTEYLTSADGTYKVLSNTTVLSP